MNNTKRIFLFLALLACFGSVFFFFFNQNTNTSSNTPQTNIDQPTGSNTALGTTGSTSTTNATASGTNKRNSGSGRLALMGMSYENPWGTATGRIRQVLEESKKTIFDSALTEQNKNEKLKAVKQLKTLLYSTGADPLARALAGEMLIGTFFDFGMQLGEWMFGKNFGERDIYEMGKYTTALAETRRAPLLVTYIGLNFYANEMDAKTVEKAIATYEKLLQTQGEDPNACGNNNKLGSIVYMAKKANIVLDAKYHDADYYFDKAIQSCAKRRHSLISFMWLVAISDSSDAKTPERMKKADELIDTMIANKSPTDSLVENLKHAYFAPIKEPDTAVFVPRLVSLYPKFKDYLNGLAKDFGAEPIK